LPNPEGISIINYTRGTTGSPKGVKVTHKNLLANCDVIDVIGVLPNRGDIYYSFLPYVHIMEELIINIVINHGVRLGIYSGNVANLHEDLEILKPSGLCAEPRVFQKIYDAINLELNKKPAIVRRVFQRALDIKIKDYNETGILKNILLDKLIFKKVRGKFEGRLSFMFESNLLNFLKWHYRVKL